jgi:hypothetical protein
LAILNTQLTDILLYSLGLGSLLVLFLPFSPMTIDLVMLSRDKQVWIYRHRRMFWAVATLCFLFLLVRAFTGMGDPVWQLIGSGTVIAMAIAFWSGCVPFVMTPPARQQLLDTVERDKMLKPDDVVLGFVYGDYARAYPRDAISRSHFFTDIVGGKSFTVSYCILCNSGVAFKNELKGEPLDLKCITAFNNNIIFQDRNSGNFIQQLDGSVFPGPDAGLTLDSEPLVFATWEEWKKLYPHTQLYFAPDITLRDKLVTMMLKLMVPIHKSAARSKSYHRTTRDLDDRLPAMSLVVGVERNGESCGYALSVLADTPVINDTVGGEPIVVLYNNDCDVAEVFSRQIEGHNLKFETLKGSPDLVARDKETKSSWDITGTAQEGVLKRVKLSPLPHFNKLFWFSWALFKTGTRVKVAA